MPEFCTVTEDGCVTIITINRPEVMNAVHPAANFELETAVQDFEANAAARVAIITGAGDKAFSAGNDLKYTAAGNKPEQPDNGFGGLTRNFTRQKPVIAAVNGIALGGGFEIALACDLIIASENALFGLPEPKVGLAALAGGLQRLPRQIGVKNALGMILTGRHVSATEGKSLGFVNEIHRSRFARVSMLSNARWTLPVSKTVSTLITTALRSFAPVRISSKGRAHLPKNASRTGAYKRSSNLFRHISPEKRILRETCRLRSKR